VIVSTLEDKIELTDGFDEAQRGPDHRGRDCDPDAEPEQGSEGKQDETHIFDRRLISRR